MWENGNVLIKIQNLHNIGCKIKVLEIGRFCFGDTIQKGHQILTCLRVKFLGYKNFIKIF